jgi:hypothetical protein
VLQLGLRLRPAFGWIGVAFVTTLDTQRLLEVAATPAPPRTFLLGRSARFRASGGYVIALGAKEERWWRWTLPTPQPGSQGESVTLDLIDVARLNSDFIAGRGLRDRYTTVGGGFSNTASN